MTSSLSMVRMHVQSACSGNREDAYPDYAKVFVSLTRANKEEYVYQIPFHGATYLPSLLLLEQIYGFPFEFYSIGRWQQYFWEAIDDVAVLDHVLATRKYSNYPNSGEYRELQ